MTQQIKHETGHVQLRVLRESAIGQNSLQLSGSTAAHARLKTHQLPPANSEAELFTTAAFFHTIPVRPNNRLRRTVDGNNRPKLLTEPETEPAITAPSPVGATERSPPVEAGERKRSPVGRVGICEKTNRGLLNGNTIDLHIGLQICGLMRPPFASQRSGAPTLS
jgi:hypothetical protein